jgi:hypothetical protein
MNHDTIAPGVYRHFKGGLYRVLHTATHSETEEPMVVYVSMENPDRVWVRPLAMWSEEVEAPGGERVPRFRPVSSSQHRRCEG